MWKWRMAVVQNNTAKPGQIRQNHSTVKKQLLLLAKSFKVTQEQLRNKLMERVIKPFIEKKRILIIPKTFLGKKFIWTEAQKAKLWEILSLVTCGIKPTSTRKSWRRMPCHHFMPWSPRILGLCSKIIIQNTPAGPPLKGFHSDLKSSRVPQSLGLDGHYWMKFFSRLRNEIILKLQLVCTLVIFV